MMQANNIKLVFSYVIATILIVGGLAIIFFTRLDPPASDVAGLRLMMSGLIGSATMYVFQREIQNGTAIQVERGISTGLASQPTITAIGGNPPSVSSIPVQPTTGADT